MGGLWWIIHKLATFSSLNSGCHQSNGIRFDLDHLHGLVPVKDGQINRLAWDTSQPKKFQWNHASSTARHERFKKIRQGILMLVYDFLGVSKHSQGEWSTLAHLFEDILSFSLPKYPNLHLKLQHTESLMELGRTFPQPNPVPQKKKVQWKTFSTSKSAPCRLSKHPHTHGLWYLPWIYWNYPLTSSRYESDPQSLWSHLKVFGGGLYHWNFNE